MSITNVLFEQRLQLVNELIEFNKNENNRICALVGEWGSGKSFFIGKFIEQVKDINNIESGEEESELPKKESFDILKFDAWENQGNGNINAIFLEFVFDELQSRVYNGRPYFEYMKDHGKEWIGELFGILSESLLPKPISKIVDIVKKGYKDFKETQSFEAYGNQLLNQILDEKSFYDILIEMLVKEEKYLIIIDELDRCEPKFAIELIKKVIYLNKLLIKKSNSVNFLISINKVEFANLLTGYYGSSYDTHQYFDKIFDYEFDLPKAQPAYEYLGMLFTESKSGQLLRNHFDGCFSSKLIDKFENLNYRKLQILAEKIQYPRDSFFINRYFQEKFDTKYYYDRVRFILEVLKLSKYNEYYEIRAAIIRLKKVICSIDVNGPEIMLRKKIININQFFNDLEIVSKYFKREGFDEVAILDFEKGENAILNEEQNEHFSHLISREILCLMENYPI